MITLKSRTFVRKVPSMKSLGNSFTKPVIFFLQSHSEDERGIFPTCGIADFPKGEIRYVHTFLPENVALLEKIDPEKTRFSLVKAGNDPHGAMKTGNNRFLLSFQYAKFLLDFNTASDEFSIVENSDLFGDSLEDLKFGATFFKSTEASRSGESRFYLTRAGKSKESLDYVLENYSCTTDLSKKELVSRKRSEHLLRPPHVSKECEGFLFHSNFFHAGYHIPSIGKICPTRTQFLERVYADLETLYRRTPQGKNDSPEKLYDPISGKELSKNFSNFIALLKKKVGATDFYELVRKTLYEVDLVPGSFDVLDLRSGKESLYRASAVATGHFEFDERRKRMFVSSHNFDPTMKGVSITYFWPGMIDRFDVLESRELKKAGTFSHPTGFRYTSHRVFDFEDRSFICTIWHPGRIFFADAETLELEYFYDLLPNDLDTFSGEDLLSYVKRVGTLPGEEFLRPIEISDDGRYVFLPWSGESYVFDFKERKTCMRIPKIEKLEFPGVNFESFTKLWAHCQYLE